MTRRSLSVSLAAIGLMLIFDTGHAAPASQRCPLDGSVASLDAAAESALCADGAGQLLIVGERHGTKETPAFVSRLITDASRKGPVRLGLEAPAGFSKTLSTFVHSRNTQANRAALLADPFWKSTDGRAGTAWLALIETAQRLRAAGHDVDAFTTEPDYHAILNQHPGEKIDFLTVKENGMAKAIEAAYQADPKALVITLMGNLHAGLHRNAAEQEPGVERSVAERLKNLSPLVILPMARISDAWNCTAEQGCGVHHVVSETAPIVKTPTFAPDADDSKVVRTVFLWVPRFTASGLVNGAT